MGVFKIGEDFYSPKNKMTLKGYFMIDFRLLNACLLSQEFDSKVQKYWFDFKKFKFLHNIDTFYYSVKLSNDFRERTTDKFVLDFRHFFKKRTELFQNSNIDYIPLNFDDITFNLKRCTFAGFYNICIEYPEYFDVFIAPVVPSGVDNTESVTCEVIVQLRSYILWLFGAVKAYEYSLSCIKKFLDYFDLKIDFCQENRIDYAWHSNYLMNPEKFFSLDNFYKMRVDRFKDCVVHTQKVGSQDYELDYISLGKRSQKVFIRIYLKSKEVIEQGYKSWFLQLWFFNGLINRYDLYVYEECFKRKSWSYRNYARLMFYAEYGQDKNLVEKCNSILSGSLTMEEDTLQNFADALTPKLNLIMNVEFQTMRRHSKSYQLLNLRDYAFHGISERIYKYFDNRSIIIDYLTHSVFRLVTPSGDINKARREYCAFWQCLRKTRLVDVHVLPEQVKLVRDYNTKTLGAMLKSRVLNSISSFGFYVKGNNSDSVLKDSIDFVCSLNDNDIQKALRYKNKKASKLNFEELTGFNNIIQRNFGLLDVESGELITNGTLNNDFCQSPEVLQDEFI